MREKLRLLNPLRKLEGTEKMNIGNLMRTLILVGLMLGAVGTLEEATRQLKVGAAHSSAHGLLSLSRLNHVLVGPSK